MYKNNFTLWPSGIYSRCKAGSTTKNQINIIHHINKKKNHIIILVDAENAFYKIQSHSWWKLSKPEVEETILNLIKNIHKNLQLTSYLMVRNYKLSPQDQEKGKDIPSSHSFSTSYWKS